MIAPARNMSCDVSERSSSGPAVGRLSTTETSTELDTSAGSSQPSQRLLPLSNTKCSAIADTGNRHAHRLEHLLGLHTELVHEQPRHPAELDRLRLDAHAARIHAGEVEQVGRELRQPVDLLAQVTGNGGNREGRAEWPDSSSITCRA